MSLGMSERTFCVDLNRTSIDLMLVENRRFMYCSPGLLILGAEGTASGTQLLGSHAEEYHAASEQYALPPYDEFIRGWIGVGGGYRDGIIHFAPAIPAENIELFERAFDFIEAALDNGLSKNSVLRGFPGAWEQKIQDVIPEEERFLDDVIASASERTEVLSFNNRDMEIEVN